MNERLGRGAHTKLRIIRTAADLFHQKGARATSPDEIIEVSHTGKGQFYHYFKNKEGLIHEVLQAYLDAIKAGTAPINYEISSWRELVWRPPQASKALRHDAGLPLRNIGQ